ncbi:TerB family tellurite resistance protein [Fulvivirgaceae bacterium PWU4]|uniref:TerB family tellurite resistance protein n=1 Tax=Chryseosolibacter histidini TaxID=2782349 RepID=A0AAP2DMN3_9BACT|nr:TerB family tellurite resistance protein [Chryseosolibacter histidini]MBT1697692.1 TerB family tellurite resistance protein [Chryseosolibacter histidini]
MTDTTRIEHFRNLVSLVAADGKIQDTEKAALSKIAYEQGIPLDRFNVMLQKANEYKYLIPQNQKEREKQLGEMIEVAMVDGEFAPAELDLIGMVAGKLGFSREDFDVILKKYKG